MSRRLYWTAVALYGICLALPATFIDQRTTAWGWEAAVYSVLPFLVWIQHPIDEYSMGLLGLGFGSSNLAFIAAAILVPLGRRRTALVCALVALASMLAGGYSVPRHASELLGGPAGQLGPGYYTWLIAGMLMVWTAFSSRSAA